MTNTPITDTTGMRQDRGVQESNSRRKDKGYKDIIHQSNNVNDDTARVAYLCAQYLEQPKGRYYFCHISLSQDTLSGREFNLFHSLPPRSKVADARTKLLTQAAFLLPGMTHVYHSGFNLGSTVLKPMQTTSKNVVQFVEISAVENPAHEKLEQQVKQHYLDAGKESKEKRGYYYVN